MSSTSCSNSIEDSSITSSAAKIGRRGAHRERQRVGRARVDLHLGSVDRDRDRGVERVVAQLGDGHLLALGLELLEHVVEQVVCHRARGRGALELHQDRRRLRVADPDRQEAVAVDRLQQDDRLLAHHVEADAIDLHLLHRQISAALGDASHYRCEGRAGRACGLGKIGAVSTRAGKSGSTR